MICPIVRAITMAWASVIPLLSNHLLFLPGEKREVAAVEKIQSTESSRSEVYLWPYPFLAVTTRVSC